MWESSMIPEYSSIHQLRPKTMNVAGKLMNMGIDFTEIVDKTFYTKTYEQNRIYGSGTGTV